MAGGPTEVKGIMPLSQNIIATYTQEPCSWLKHLFRPPSPQRNVLLNAIRMSHLQHKTLLGLCQQDKNSTAASILLLQNIPPVSRVYLGVAILL